MLQKGTKGQPLNIGITYKYTLQKLKDLRTRKRPNAKVRAVRGKLYFRCDQRQDG